LQGVKDVERSAISRIASKVPLSGPYPVGNRPLWDRKDGYDAVRVANVKEHAFRVFPHHFPGLEIDDEERLHAFEGFGVSSLFLQTGEDGSMMIAEMDFEPEQFFGTFDFLDGFNGTDAHIDGLEGRKRDNRFDRS
jgi:hypothetical protein